MITLDFVFRVGTATDGAALGVDASVAPAVSVDATQQQVEAAINDVKRQMAMEAEESKKKLLQEHQLEVSRLEEEKAKLQHRVQELESAANEVQVQHQKIVQGVRQEAARRIEESKAKVLLPNPDLSLVHRDVSSCVGSLGTS